MDAEQQQQQDTAAPAAASSALDLAAVRELAIAAHPQAVPELIRGDSVEEIMASIPAAREAYERIAQRVTPADAAAALAAGLPEAAHGSPVRTVAVDPEVLSPASKIRYGLEARKAMGAR